MVVVDYGRGNLLSISRALKHVGATVEISSGPEAVASAERLLLPGVGAFGDGMRGLRERGLIEPVREFCASGQPFLGICLGMQLLMTESLEFGRHEGLNLVPGRVVPFPESDFENGGSKIPHVGWNSLAPVGRETFPAGSILSSLDPGAWVYFVHSYVAQPENAAHQAARTFYAGSDFCSVIEAGNISGCQFHPEKSGETGLAILKNWISL